MLRRNATQRKVEETEKIKETKGWKLQKSSKNNNEVDFSIKRNVTVTENGHLSICQQPFCHWRSVSNDANDGFFTAAT